MGLVSCVLYLIFHITDELSLSQSSINNTSNFFFFFWNNSPHKTNVKEICGIYDTWTEDMHALGLELV